MWNSKYEKYLYYVQPLVSCIYLYNMNMFSVFVQWDWHKEILFLFSFCFTAFFVPLIFCIGSGGFPCSLCKVPSSFIYIHIFISFCVDNITFSFKYFWHSSTDVSNWCHYHSLIQLLSFWIHTAILNARHEFYFKIMNWLTLNWLFSNISSVCVCVCVCVCVGICAHTCL